MNFSKLLNIILICSLLAWAGEAIYLTQKVTATPDRIKAEEGQKRKLAGIRYQKVLRELEQEYDKKKHLATGESVYDRIYNAQEQSILELIQNLADETLPESWSSDVKVEEFTHFILLIYLPHNSRDVLPSQVVSYLGPILEHCEGFLNDVVVFDSRHKSYLFFDTAMLDEIKKSANLSQKMLARAEKQGQSFTQFNSTTVECEKYESHLFLPLEITGPNGVVTCYALVDTGASTTTLSSEVVTKTGFENLQNVPQRSFSTANGTMSSPIVTRGVNVAGISKDIEIAVNQKDDINLLGVNYFEGMDYILDFKNSAIYVWGK